PGGRDRRAAHRRADVLARTPHIPGLRVRISATNRTTVSQHGRAGAIALAWVRSFGRDGALRGTQPGDPATPLRTMSTQVRPAEPPTTRPTLTPWLVCLFAGGVGLSPYFLIPPALGHPYPGYYRPRQYPFTYGYNRPLLLLFIPYGLVLLAWKRGARVRLGW